jgi:hypothetical protein
MMEVQDQERKYSISVNSVLDTGHVFEASVNFGALNLILSKPILALGAQSAEILRHQTASYFIHDLKAPPSKRIFCTMPSMAKATQETSKKSPHDVDVRLVTGRR